MENVKKEVTVMTEQKRKRGAPPGNKNAVGHGAPKGNQNAVGNRGGKGGPVGNKYAVGRGRPKSAVIDSA